MPIVTILGQGSFEVEKGRKLVLALEDNGVHILHQCGGQAKCTTCRVEVLEGDFFDLRARGTNTFSDTEIHRHLLMEDHLRLSCQVRVKEDITILPIMTVENTGMDVGPRPDE